MASHGTTRAGGRISRADIALGTAVVAVALYVVAMLAAEDDNGWLWPVAGVVGAVAAIQGWQVGRSRPHGRALAAIVLGGLVFLTILAWVVVAAFTGDL